jgi:hypothetical protein
MGNLFVFLGGVLVNLQQIAWVGDTGEGRLGLHMSDGKTIVVEGKDAVEQLVETLTEFSMVPDGTPLNDALAMGRTPEAAELRDV